MNSRKFFYLVVVFWLLIFSGFIAYREYTLQTGREVLLKTVPVDPRDLFRGDYVTLRYDISTLNLSDGQAEDANYMNYTNNARIYLALQLKDGYGVPKKLYKNPPGGELFIKGRAKGITYERSRDNASMLPVHRLRVEYGIESYFLPEGLGGEIERQRRDDKKIDVLIAVDRFGNAAIKKILIDGNEFKY